MKLLRGVRHGPLRVVLFGPEGVGKSSWASDAPGAAFLPVEDGLRHLDVARIPWPNATAANPLGVPTFDAAMAILRFLASPNPPGDLAQIGTLVVDTIDRLEGLLREEIARPCGGILDDVGGGFQKGAKRVAEVWGEFLGLLDRVQAVRPVHVILLAHAKRHTWKNPGSVEWQRWSLDLLEGVASQTLAWADEVLFATFEVQSKKAKAPGVLTGRRTLRTAPGPGWAGKSRCGLPDPMALDFGAFWQARAAALRGEADSALVAEARAIAAQLPDDKRLEPKSGKALLEIALAAGPGHLRRFVTWAQEQVDPAQANDGSPQPEVPRADALPAPSQDVAPAKPPRKPATASGGLPETTPANRAPADASGPAVGAPTGGAPGVAPEEPRHQPAAETTGWKFGDRVRLGATHGTYQARGPGGRASVILDGEKADRLVDAAALAVPCVGCQAIEDGADPFTPLRVDGPGAGAGAMLEEDACPTETQSAPPAKPSSASHASPPAPTSTSASSTPTPPVTAPAGPGGIRKPSVRRG